jgi:2,3-bisphosphoglycerate-independent phosphoglycerate mutase
VVARGELEEAVENEPAVDPGASAAPEGLTARVRPEARPETRAANLSGVAKSCVYTGRGACAALASVAARNPRLIAKRREGALVQARLRPKQPR